MIKILSIGNSFSEDSTKYLHKMAVRGNIDVKTVNLYIGGCSLFTHWQNAQEDNAKYDYQLNGESAGEYVSIKQALLSDSWDYVTLQQASYDSGVEETYFPYLTNLSQYVKALAPSAVQLIHKTWAYELDSTHDGFEKYERTQAVMFAALSKAYEKASAAINAELIPTGDVIQVLRKLPEFDYANGGRSLCRDGFHLDLIYGRYAAAASWYETILKGNILTNDFVPKLEGKETDIGLIEIIKKTVHDICS